MPLHTIGDYWGVHVLFLKLDEGSLNVCGVGGGARGVLRVLGQTWDSFQDAMGLRLVKLPNVKTMACS